MYQIYYRDMFGTFQTSQCFSDAKQAIDWCLRLSKLALVWDARIEVIEGVK
jgi:hypothetical protein